MRSKLLCCAINVKFNDPKTGNSLKNRRLCGELKECVLGHAITVHKSQGSTLDYMQGDLY